MSDDCPISQHFVEMQFCGMNVTLSIAVHLGIPVHIRNLHISPSSFSLALLNHDTRILENTALKLGLVSRHHRGRWCILRSTEMLYSVPKSSFCTCSLGVLNKHNRNIALLRGQLGFSSLPLNISNMFCYHYYTVATGGVPLLDFMHRAIHGGHHISRVLRYVTVQKRLIHVDSQMSQE